ncbi:hypothetical protein LOTGIDRAFT_154020 [Lottia gigantea]|uniref:Uncharacterized protein n=1 Tax=Lottia gigantea TaxID=225164 RepID=V3ZX57_LOTGI|nr:hypothetical protein LOTGIDRAFT_154020 [Lottia gigantea]ESO88952.1 hypothetical protein LOTGIDRAFT_154020 [Lottia gigantea]
MAVDVEVANESSQPTPGNGNFIKSLIIGVVVVVLGLTTVLVGLRFSKRSLPVETVEVMPPNGQLNSALKDGLPVVNETGVPDKGDNIVEKVQEKVGDLVEPLTEAEESEASIEILKEVLGNMKEYISNDEDEKMKPYFEIEASENEMPTPRMIDLSESESGLSTETEEDFDDDNVLNVPKAFGGEDSEEMSENPTLEEISTIVKKIIESYREQDDLKGFFDSEEMPYDSELDNNDVVIRGTPLFPEEADAAEHLDEHIKEVQNNFGEPIINQVFTRPSHDQEHLVNVQASHNNHDYLSAIGLRTITSDQTNSNHDNAGVPFVFRGHRTHGLNLKDNIGDHVFPIRSEDIHDDFAQLRGMSQDESNRHLNSRFPNLVTPSNNPTVPRHNGHFLVGKLDEVGLVEGPHGFIKDVAEDVNGDVIDIPLDGIVNGFTTEAYPLSGLLNTPPAIEFPSETVNNGIAIESPPTETTSKAVTIEPILTETVATIESPLLGTFSIAATPSDVTMVSPRSDTNKATEVEFPLSETISKAATIEPLFSETVDKVAAIESPILGTFSTDAMPRDTEMVSPRSDTNKAIEKESPLTETINKAATIEPLFSETGDKVAAIESPILGTFSTDAMPRDTEMVSPRSDTNKATEIESPSSETTNKAAAMEPPPVIPLNKASPGNP